MRGLHGTKRSGKMSECHCAQCSGAGPDTYGWTCPNCRELLSLQRGVDAPELVQCADCEMELCPSCCQFECGGCEQHFCAGHARYVEGVSTPFCPGCCAEMIVNEEV